MGAKKKVYPSPRLSCSCSLPLQPDEPAFPHYLYRLVCKSLHTHTHTQKQSSLQYLQTMHEASSPHKKSCRTTLVVPVCRLIPPVSHTGLRRAKRSCVACHACCTISTEELFALVRLHLTGGRQRHSFHIMHRYMLWTPGQLPSQAQDSVPQQ